MHSCYAHVMTRTKKNTQMPRSARHDTLWGWWETPTGARGHTSAWGKSVIPPLLGATLQFD